MGTVHKTREFDHPADELWALIGDFHGMHKWIPAMAEPTESIDGGKRRTLAMPMGAIIERLLEQGDRSYTYAIEEGPFPVANYRSTISVKDAGNGKSVVDWHGTFDPAEGTTEEAGAQIVEMVYEAGLAGLEQTLSQ
jgi:hypothetical protein